MSETVTKSALGDTQRKVISALYRNVGGGAGSPRILSNSIGISHHAAGGALRRLRNTGLVRSERRGREEFFTLTYDGVEVARML